MPRIRVALAVGLALVCGAVFADVAAAASPDVVVSEFRTRGPSGGNDEFVELYNASAAPVAIGGWTIRGSNASGTVSTRVTIDDGRILGPGCHFLATNSGAYGGAVAGDQTYGTGITDNGGIALALADGTLVDQVGMSSGSAYREGTPLAQMTTNVDRSYERKPGGALGSGTDTGDNASDFRELSPSDPQNATSTCVAGTARTDPSGIGAATPASVERGSATLLTVAVSPGANPASTGLTVTADLTSIGGSPAQQLRDDGANGDETAGDGTFSYRATVAAATAPGAKTLPVVIADAEGRTGSASIALGVTAVCGSPFTHVYEIQGAGAESPLSGSVATEGVVVGDYEGPSPALRGFYVQDATGDGDPATSDGVFVFEGNAERVEVGDLVRVGGSVQEFQGQTQLSASSVTVCATGRTVAPVDVTLPVPPAAGGVDYLERYEGMLVRLHQTLSVTEHFQLGRFGQVVLSAGGRLQVPTSVVTPGAAANALEEANQRDRIVLDDATNDQNPDPILFGRGGDPLSAANTLRGGDTVTDAVGVLTYTWAGNAASGNAYRVRPVGALGGGVPDFQPANPRPSAPPAVGGSLRVGATNLLNYFDTFGATACSGGVGGPTMECRGASSQAEFDRQWPKTVAAITGLGADVVGIMELENDGYGPTSAIADLVGKLNAATAPGTFAFVDVDAATGQVNALGDDAIRVGLIYRPARVTPVGQTAVLNTPEFVNGGDSAPRNRPSLAQAFRLADGETFVVDVNHLKSKGSACDAPDAGDGQGNCAAVRERAARLLAAWLATDPTGVRDPDVLLVGDLNSYAKEDSIAALEQGGFENLIADRIGAGAYSYVFDGEWGYLDHALATDPLAAQVTGVGEWHVNADEPSVLDYTTDFKSAAQQASLYAPDRFRMSDHDPVLVGLDLETTAAGVCTLTRAYVTKDQLETSLCVKLQHGSYGAYANEVRAQSGKALTQLHAEILLNLARQLS